MSASARGTGSVTSSSPWARSNSVTNIAKANPSSDGGGGMTIADGDIEVIARIGQNLGDQLQGLDREDREAGVGGGAWQRRGGANKVSFIAVVPMFLSYWITSQGCHSCHWVCEQPPDGRAQPHDDFRELQGVLAKQTINRPATNMQTLDQVINMGPSISIIMVIIPNNKVTEKNCMLMIIIWPLQGSKYRKPQWQMARWSIFPGLVFNPPRDRSQIAISGLVMSSYSEDVYL